MTTAKIIGTVQIACLCVFIVLTVVSLILLFTVPPLSSVALLLELPLLAFAYGIEKLRQKSASRNVAAGSCPWCLGPLDEVNEARWRCPSCGKEWLASGDVARMPRFKRAERRPQD